MHFAGMVLPTCSVAVNDYKVYLQSLGFGSLMEADTSRNQSNDTKCSNEYKVSVNPVLGSLRLDGAFHLHQQNI